MLPEMNKKVKTKERKKKEKLFETTAFRTLGIRQWFLTGKPSRGLGLWRVRQ